MKYYCVYVLTGTEQFFKEEAEKKVRAIDPQSEFYFFSSVLWLGKTVLGKTEEKASLSGYVFFRVEELRPEVLIALKEIKGYIRILMAEDNITEVRGTEYEILQSLLKYGRVLPMSEAEYTEGNRIQILSGPLKDFEGYIGRVDRREQRVIVFLPLFGGMSKIELSYRMVRKID